MKRTFLQCVCLCGTKSQSQCELSCLWFFFVCFAFDRLIQQLYHPSIIFVTSTTWVYYPCQMECFMVPNNQHCHLKRVPLLFSHFYFSPKKHVRRIECQICWCINSKGKINKRVVLQLLALPAITVVLRLSVSVCLFLHKTVCLSCVQVSNCRHWLSNTMTCAKKWPKEDSYGEDSLPKLTVVYFWWWWNYWG